MTIQPHFITVNYKNCWLRGHLKTILSIMSWKLAPPPPPPPPNVTMTVSRSKKWFGDAPLFGDTHVHYKQHYNLQYHAQTQNLARLFFVSIHLRVYWTTRKLMNINHLRPHPYQQQLRASHCTEPKQHR